MEPPYIPISCAMHDELLALATLRRECEIVFIGSAGAVERLRGTIEDVYTRSGAEYLRLVDGTTIRLDRLVSVDGKEVPRAEI